MEKTTILMVCVTVCIYYIGIRSTTVPTTTKEFEIIVFFFQLFSFGIIISYTIVSKLWKNLYLFFLVPAIRTYRMRTILGDLI